MSDETTSVDGVSGDTGNSGDTGSGGDQDSSTDQSAKAPAISAEAFAAIKAEVAEQRAKGEVLAASLKKSTSTKRKAEKKDADDVASQMQSELEKLQASNEGMQAKLKAHDDASLARIDKAIESLGKDAQSEIGLIRDSIGLSKLEELVALKAKAGVAGETKPAIPSAAAPEKGGRTRKQDGHEMPAEVRAGLQSVGARASVYETSKKLGFMTIDDSQVWGWGFSDDPNQTDTMRTTKFIDLMDALADDPFRAIKEATAARIKGLPG